MPVTWLTTVARLSRICGVNGMADMIEIKLVRSTIGRKPEQRATVRSLGLRKISSKTVKEATPSVLGMIHAVKHLVKVTPITGDTPAKGGEKK